jgi:mono/diheme cytochrome c family protein
VNNALKMALLTILTTLFYTYVGHMVPQKVTYPPESVELSADMTTAEMVSAGEEIVGGKGTCLTCHTIGAHEAGRFPDLGGIGARAASRREGLSDVEYLAESLYDPNAYIVEGFNPGMIPASKPPVSLSDQEILSVIAYLQSLGGTPTVTMNTKLKYAGASPPSTEPATAAAATASSGPMDATQLLTTYACVTCHKLDEAGPLVGPSLFDVGGRLSQGDLYESIMSPDATLAEGFPGGVMTATLQGMQFYEKVSANEVKALVDHLAGLKGDE